MIENPKELNGFWITKYWIESVPEHRDENNAIGPISFIDNPIEFRCKRFNGEGVKRSERQLIAAQMSTDAGQQLETYSNLKFKREDLILDNLELLPPGLDDQQQSFTQTRLNGLRYKNFSRVSAVNEIIDEELDPLNLIGVDIAVRKVITIG